MTLNALASPPERRPPIVATSILAAGAVVLACYATVVGLSPSRPRTEKTLADQARDDLRARKPTELSGPLRTILDDRTTPRIPTEPHPLVGHAAPTFTLPDVEHRPTSLDELCHHGPVVVVFYYGYNCDHCVSQLFGLHEDLKYFRELDVTVVAIGPDTSEQTREKYAEFGAFGFPVLADVDRHVAARFGLYRPPTSETKSWQAHGTFVLDRKGIVRWANTGPKPFTENATLLAVIAGWEKH